MKSSSKPMDIVGQLNKMAGFAPDEEIELFEVGAGAFKFYLLVMHMAM